MLKLGTLCRAASTTLGARTAMNDMTQVIAWFGERHVRVIEALLRQIACCGTVGHVASHVYCRWRVWPTDDGFEVEHETPVHLGGLWRMKAGWDEDSISQMVERARTLHGN